MSSWTHCAKILAVGRRKPPQKPAGRAFVDTDRVARGFKWFGGNGLLDYDLIATDSDGMRINVHRCAHAELMKQLGGEGIGAIMLCGEDHVMAARAGNRLERPSTIMQGASSCRFRYLPGEGAR